MVAGTHYYRFITVRFADNIWWWFCIKSVYLYFILMQNKHLETILVFVTVLVIIFLFTKNIYFIYGSLVMAGIGILIPPLSKLIHQGWMKLASLMASVMNRVILSLVFFIILAPIAFISRLFRKDPFKNKDTATGSSFVERNFTYNKKSLEELW